MSARDHIKKETARNPIRNCGRVESGRLDFFLLRRGGGGLRSLRLDEALLEFVHTAGGIHEFLRAGVERVAGIADADDDGGAGGAGLDHVAAGATDFRVSIFRMYVRLHNKRGATLSRINGKTRRNFAYPQSAAGFLGQSRKIVGSPVILSLLQRR